MRIFLLILPLCVKEVSAKQLYFITCGISNWDYSNDLLACSSISPGVEIMAEKMTKNVCKILHGSLIHKDICKIENSDTSKISSSFTAFSEDKMKKFIDSLGERYRKEGYEVHIDEN